MGNGRGAIMKWLGLGLCLVVVPGLAASDSAGAEVFVRASQVGYEGADLKVGMAFSSEPIAGRFAVIDARTGATVFEGRAEALPGENWGRFSQYAELDFSAVSAPGATSCE